MHPTRREWYPPSEASVPKLFTFSPLLHVPVHVTVPHVVTYLCLCVFFLWAAALVPIPALHASRHAMSRDRAAER